MNYQRRECRSGYNVEVGLWYRWSQRTGRLVALDPCVQLLSFYIEWQDRPADFSIPLTEATWVLSVSLHVPLTRWFLSVNNPVVIWEDVASRIWGIWSLVVYFRSFRRRDSVSSKFMSTSLYLRNIQWIFKWRLATAGWLMWRQLKTPEGDDWKQLAWGLGCPLSWSLINRYKSLCNGNKF